MSSCGDYNSLSQDLDNLFPKEFCKNPVRLSDANNISKDACFCPQRKHCFAVKDILLSATLQKIEISQKVKASCKSNFEGSKILINTRIDTYFMNHMLVDYFDVQVTEFLRYGFPIEVNDNCKEILFGKSP
jgi:hypothetical protein